MTKLVTNSGIVNASSLRGVERFIAGMNTGPDLLV
jgi:hypothetical protein